MRTLGSAQRMAILALGLLAACGGGTEPTPEPELVLALSVVSGGDQAAAVANELPEAVVVRVTRAPAAARLSNGFVADEPVPGQIVNFVIVSGGGSVFAGTGVTNDLGEVRERWTLGNTAGTQVLEARAVDPSTGEPIVFDRIEATGQAGPISVAVLDANRMANFLVGQTLELDPLIVRPIEDAYGNEVQYASVNWSMHFEPGATAFNPDPVGQSFDVQGDTVTLTEALNGTLTVLQDGRAVGHGELQVQ